MANLKAPFPRLSRGHPLARGLVGAWGFYEGSGPKLYDLSGNGNDGTLANGPVWAGGAGGSCLSFDGTDDEVRLGSPPSLNLTAPHTVAALIYPTSFGGNGLGRIFDKNDGSSSIGYYFCLDNSSITSGLQFGLGNGVVGATKSNNNAVSLNQWQLVAYAYTGDRVNFWVNGKAVGTTSFATNPPSAPSTTATIGGRASDTLRQFAGKMSLLLIFGRPLDSTDIGMLQAEFGP